MPFKLSLLLAVSFCLTTLGGQPVEATADEGDSLPDFTNRSLADLGLQAVPEKKDVKTGFREGGHNL